MNRSAKAKTTESTVGDVPENSSRAVVSAPVKRSRKPLLIAAAVVAVAIAVGVGFWVYHHYHHKPKPYVAPPGTVETIDQIKSAAPPAGADPTELATYDTTLGIAYVSAGQTQAGIDVLLKAESYSKVPADNYGVWLDLAQAYEKQGDKKSAIPYYQKALNFVQHPSDGSAPDKKLVTQFQQKIKQLGS